jgi:hypothetical protein
MADPLRSGYAFSNSPNDFTKPPISFKVPAGLGIAAAVIIGFFVVNNAMHGSSNSTTTQFVPDSTQVTQPGADSQPTYHPKIVRTSAPVVAPPVRSQTLVSRPAPLVVHATQAPATPTTQPANAATAPDGCRTLQIASVSGDGAEVVVADGRRYAVSEDMLMRARASDWVTGEPVSVCTSPEGVSLRTTAYGSVQATLAGRTGSIAMAGCRPLYIAYTAGDGSEIGTTDGSVFHVTSNMLSRARAADWATGESVTACAASDGGATYVSISEAYGNVETVREKTGTGDALQPACRQGTVERGASEGQSIHLDDGAYRIDDNMLMQARARDWTTGDTVTVCRYSIAGMTYASISRGYGRVQTTKVR